MSRWICFTLAVCCLAAGLPAQQTSAPAPVLSPVPTLVLIELAGGLDGLSALVPYADPAYAKARPTLAPAAGDVIKLSDAVGLHPSFAPLLDSWKAGDFAVVQGVGYPDPNLSHFRSIAIWESASGSHEVWETGWLQRLFTASPRWPALAADSVILGETHPGPLKGPGMHNLSFDNLDTFLREATTLEESPRSTGASAAIAQIQKDIESAAAALTAVKPQIKEPAVPFPNSNFGKQMKLGFQLLAAGARVPVLKLTLRGFDTHTNQKAELERLLKDLASTVAAFRANAVTAGLWDKVLVMTFSEFGRRVGENDSGGTDHGTASPLFLWGGRVKGGLYGTQPSLVDLDQGNLKFTVDFRSVFRSAAAGLWNLPEKNLSAAFPNNTETLPIWR